MSEFKFTIKNTFSFKSKIYIFFPFLAAIFLTRIIYIRVFTRPLGDLIATWSRPDRDHFWSRRPHSDRGDQADLWSRPDRDLIAATRWRPSSVIATWSRPGRDRSQPQILIATWSRPEWSRPVATRSREDSNIYRYIIISYPLVNFWHM